MKEPVHKKTFRNYVDSQDDNSLFGGFPNGMIRRSNSSKSKKDENYSIEDGPIPCSTSDDDDVFLSKRRMRRKSRIVEDIDESNLTEDQCVKGGNERRMKDFKKIFEESPSDDAASSSPDSSKPQIDSSRDENMEIDEWSIFPNNYIKTDEFWSKITEEFFSAKFQTEYPMRNIAQISGLTMETMNKKFIQSSFDPPLLNHFSKKRDRPTNSVIKQSDRDRITLTMFNGQDDFVQCHYSLEQPLVSHQSKDVTQNILQLDSWKVKEMKDNSTYNCFFGDEVQLEIDFLQNKFQDDLKKTVELIQKLTQNYNKILTEETKLKTGADKLDCYYSNIISRKSILLSLKKGIVDKLNQDEDDDDGICGVCFDGTSHHQNPIIFCDSCNLAVHQYCYGLNCVPEDDFFCDTCRLIKKQRDFYRCFLCNQRGGIMKYNLKLDQWFHGACILLCPSVNIETWSTLQDIQIKPLNPMTSFHSCNVCCSLSGHQIKCSKDSCTVYFHPLCGWLHGMHASLNFDLPMSTNNKIEYTIQMYCLQHTPKEIKCKNRSTQSRIRRKHHSTISQDNLDGQKNRKEKIKPIYMIEKTKETFIETMTEYYNHFIEKELDIDIYEDDQCQICCNKIYKKDEQITCSQCQANVHINCIEIEINKKIAWVCFTCQLDENNQTNLLSKRCLLCPHQGGFLLPTYPQAQGRVHYFCAKSIPKACLIKKDYSSSLPLAVDVSRIPIKIRECIFCHNTYGITIQCHAKECNVSIHPLCGKFHHVCFQPSYQKYFYCSQHLPECMKWNEEMKLWKEKTILDRVSSLPLRVSLDQSRLLIGLCAKRDKMKRRALDHESNLLDSVMDLLTRNELSKEGKEAIELLTGQPFGEMLINKRKRTRINYKI